MDESNTLDPIDTQENLDSFDVSGPKEVNDEKNNQTKVTPHKKGFFNKIHPSPRSPTTKQDVRKPEERKKSYVRKGSYTKSHSTSQASSDSILNSKKVDLISTMVMKETIRNQNHKQCFMLHPMSTFVSYWTALAAILLIYISISVPLFLAFEPSLPASYSYMDMLIDVFFIFDIAVNFRTGYFPNYNRPDLVIMNPVEVTKAYLKSWFVVDLFSGIPFVSIGFILFDGNGTESGLPEHELKLLKLARILRLAKLTKLAKVSAFARRMDEAYVDLMVTYPGVVIAMRMFKLILVGVSIVHYMSCGWFMVGSIHKNGWVYETESLKLPISEQYLISVYWVVTTMTTVGYGDISADNGPERGFSIFAMITGCGFYGLLIAQITSIVAEAESNRRIIAERIDAIAAYVHAKDFSPQLQKQILVYYRNFLKKNSVIDEWAVLKDLSSGLREKVINHLMTAVISSNPFFIHLQHHTSELFHIMHLQVVERGQHFSRKGQLSRDMLILLVGSAVILDESEASVKAGHGEPIYPLYEVTPGAIFGERCALGLDESYNTTVRALTNCELYVIFADELLAALGRRIFNGLRRKCMQDPLFKVKLRSYCIANISDEHMEMLKKLMFELPSDPVRRTWSRRTKTKSPSHSEDIANNNDDDDDEDDKIIHVPSENKPFAQDAHLAHATGKRRPSDFVNNDTTKQLQKSNSMSISNEVNNLSNKVTELTLTIENMQKMMLENQENVIKQQQAHMKQIEMLMSERLTVTSKPNSPYNNTLPPIL